MTRRLRGAAHWLTALETGGVALAAPLLLFPSFRPSWTAVALVLLAGVWALYWIGTGRPAVSTPLDLALLGLLLMVPVAVWASAFPDLTLPKLTGLILSIAAFRATVHASETHRRLAWAVAAFMALGLGLALVGLLGTSWSDKLPVLDPVLGRIPRLVPGLPGAEAGIQPNELGGALLLFLPMATALALAPRERSPESKVHVRLVGWLLALFFAAVLFLTQSRSAWLGALVGLGVMTWLRWHRAGWLMLAGLLLLAVGVLLVGPQEVARSALQSVDTGGTETVVGAISLAGRVELWGRALYAIEDFSFTGTGLGTFRRVVHLLYPLYLVGPDSDVAHAHNLFLQVALDVGLPGLVAYTALVGLALWIAWRVAWPAMGCGPGSVAGLRWLGLGVVGSLVAFHVYGLTDTIALGARPGVALWMLLAFAARLSLEVPGALGCSPAANSAGSDEA